MTGDSMAGLVMWKDLSDPVDGWPFACRSQRPRPRRAREKLSPPLRLAFCCAICDAHTRRLNTVRGPSVTRESFVSPCIVSGVPHLLAFQKCARRGEVEEEIRKIEERLGELEELEK